jgi:chemotaxis protein MotB
MKRFIILIAVCCFALHFSGCFPKTGVDASGNDTPLKNRISSDRPPTIDELDHALETARLEIDQCRQENDWLKSGAGKADAEARVLDIQIGSLNQTIEKQAAVISLQNSIIRLFDDSQQTLQASIQEQIDAGDLETGGSTQTIKYVLSNQLLFEPNGVELSSGGMALLAKLADVLLKESYPYIRVLGHTDDRPLKSSSRFADNWELSAARAAAVVRFFHETLGVAPQRMTAVGCGQFLPLAENDTDEGRSRNRRTEIILEAGRPPAATVEIPGL